jgi:hypothetical protein
LLLEFIIGLAVISIVADEIQNLLVDPREFQANSRETVGRIGVPSFLHDQEIGKAGGEFLADVRLVLKVLERGVQTKFFSMIYLPYPAWLFIILKEISTRIATCDAYFWSFAANLNSY